MAEEATAAPGKGGADGLLQLAMSRPVDALAKATSVLADRPDAYEASVAHQTIGIVQRDNGDVKAGLRELRTALRLARRSGSADREADVLGSLGPALVLAGLTAPGLRALDSALELSQGVQVGRVLHRRGVVLWLLGRHLAALNDLRRAVTVLQRADDIVWTARALDARGLVHLYLGSPGRADADFLAAARLYAETDQELDSANAVLNRGVAALRSGDLPAALAFVDEAAARYRPLSIPTPYLSDVRCSALQAAGLTQEALAEADAAITEIERGGGSATRRADMLLTAGASALAAGRLQEAIERARRALRLFRAQQSAWGEAHAELILALSKYAAHRGSAEQLRAADNAAAHLEAVGSSEVASAHLLAGRIALDLGRVSEADQQLSIAERSRGRGPALSRAVGWLSRALRAEAAGDPRRMLTAARRGLETLDEHRWTLGSSELRAHATAHGSELAGLALRHAAQAGNPRMLLSWTERWRATALAVPSVRPAADEELTGGLTALRGIMSRLEDARRQGAPTAALEREQVRLESAVRARSLQASGVGRDTAGQATFDVAGLLDRIGAETQLAEIVDVDGALHVLLCGAGRVRHFIAGQTSDASRSAEFARFALRRLARSRTGSDPGGALAILRRAGPQLQEALLGPAVAHLRDVPTVVVPPGRLHGIPWALLPALQHRPLSVAPSASAWMRASATKPPPRRSVVLARGPGLVTNGAEVPTVADLYDDANVLSDSDATAGKVLAALDGAWLAHIAAHGTFRADSPMFSALRLHDGPLTVYDFEQLNRAPHWLVLSSCDSGVLAPAGADELLGLASSLLPLGTTGIVAGVVQLNDNAVVPLMVDLHRGLRAGQGLAEALYRVRAGGSSEPAELAAALSLLTLGAG